MSLVEQPRIREDLMIEALVAVKLAKQQGTPFRIENEAVRIRRKYPDCPVSLDEPVATIAGLCAWERVPLRFK
jgi:hypothetical protein